MIGKSHHAQVFSIEKGASLTSFYLFIYFFGLVCLRMVVLLISASKVARITVVKHRSLTALFFLKGQA
jgi:hypothetical protein